MFKVLKKENMVACGSNTECNSDKGLSCQNVKGDQVCSCNSASWWNGTSCSRPNFIIIIRKIINSYFYWYKLHWARITQHVKKMMNVKQMLA